MFGPSCCCDLSNCIFLTDMSHKACDPNRPQNNRMCCLPCSNAHTKWQVCCLCPASYLCCLWSPFHNPQTSCSPQSNYPCHTFHSPQICSPQKRPDVGSQLPSSCNWCNWDTSRRIRNPHLHDTKHTSLVHHRARNIRNLSDCGTC